MTSSFPARRRDRFSALLMAVVMLAVSTALFAQSNGSPDDQPLVSRLRLSIREPQIRLSWEPSPDASGNTLLYRSNSEITSDTLPDADVVGIVAADVGSFIDVPPVAGLYYYAVLVAADDGTPFGVVIADRNATGRPVEIETTATQVDLAALVTALEAQVIAGSPSTGASIRITLRADRPGRTIALYRSTSPIVTAEDLTRATLFREIDSSADTADDLPVPGIDYYYAAVDAGALLDGVAEVIPDSNATTRPIVIALPESTRAVAQATPGAPATAPSAPASPSAPATPEAQPVARPGRGIPLPFLRPSAGFTTGMALTDTHIALPDSVPVRPETEQAIARLSSRFRPEPTRLDFVILREDRIAEPHGAEYTLRTILDGPMRSLAWEEGVGQLTNYFTLPLTPELRARAHFYRAQAYYFLGEERESLLEFLHAREPYYAEVQVWIDSILAEMSGTTASRSESGE